jgi:hypothetical protein
VPKLLNVEKAAAKNKELNRFNLVLTLLFMTAFPCTIPQGVTGKA